MYKKYIKYKIKYLDLKNKLKNIQIGGQNNGIEMYEWIDYYKPKHLTIGDLKKWNKDETSDVLVLDRNFEEYFIWDLKKYHDYDPKYFFKENKCRIRNNGDGTWQITYPWKQKVCHDVEINTKVLGSSHDWCPMKNGYITIESKPIKKIYWEDLDDNIRIGWRGPMIFWDDIQSEPKIYQVDIKDDKD